VGKDDLKNMICSSGFEVQIFDSQPSNKIKYNVHWISKFPFKYYYIICKRMVWSNNVL